MIKFIVLAAGTGTRFYGGVNGKPKALSRFLNKTLLDHQLSITKQFKNIDCFLITGFQAKMFSKYKKYFKSFFHNKDFRKTNMVYSLFKGKELFDGKSDIIISYGDIIFEKKILEKLLNSNKKISIAVDKQWKNLWSIRMDDPLNDIESLKINEKKEIISIGKKVRSLSEVDAQYIGLTKIRKDFTIDFFKIWDQKLKDKNLYMTDYLQFLIDENIAISPVLINNGWLEFDTQKDLKNYLLAYKKGTLKIDI